MVNIDSVCVTYLISDTAPSVASLQRGKITHQRDLDMILNNPMTWLRNRSLEKYDYPFIAITPRSILSKSVST